MKETEEREVKRLETYVNGIVCNKCGKETWTNENLNMLNFHEFFIYFRYGSVFDQENWEFDLCENCILSIIKTFKYAPDGFGGHRRSQEAFDEWKEV